MKTHNKKGRRFPNTVTPTGRRINQLSRSKIEMLETIHHLGVASSPILKEFLRLEGITSKSYQGKIITNMVHEHQNADGDVYLMRPKEQRPKKQGGPQPFLAHDLGLGGVNLLKRLGKWRDIVHGGHWEHQLQEATFLWEIYLGVKDVPGLTFLPHHMCSPLGTPNIYRVPINWESQTIQTELKPDAHFAIDYHGERRCHFFYEADRGTEQKSKYIYGKKTIERMILQYKSLIGAKGNDPLYHKLLDTRDPALVLLHFKSRADKEAAKAIILKHTKGNGSNYFLLTDDERFIEPEFYPPNFSLINFEGLWERVGRPPIYINTLKEKAAS